MAALSVSCVQQYEFAVGKYLKSVMFLEQTCQNSLENCAETLLGLISQYALYRPLAVEADTLLVPSLVPAASAVSTYRPGLPVPLPQHRLGQGEIDHCALVQLMQLRNFAPKRFGGWSNNKEMVQFLLELFGYRKPSLYGW